MLEFFIFCFVVFWLFMGLITNYLYIKKKTEIEQTDVKVKDFRKIGAIMLLGPIAFWWRHVDYVVFKAKSN